MNVFKSVNLTYVNMSIVKDASEVEAMTGYLTSNSEKLIALDTETNGLDLSNMKLEGIGLGNKDKQFYIPEIHFMEKEIKESFQEIFKHNRVIFHNAKFDLQVLKLFDLPIPSKIHDTLILSWLFDENSAHDLKTLTRLYLSREVEHWENIDRTVSLLRPKEEIIHDLGIYCCSDVVNTYDLLSIFLPKIKRLGILKAYEHIELPIIRVLADMELRGVRVDLKWLVQKETEIAQALKEYKRDLQESVSEHVYSNFNFNSPQQLSTLLFEKLGYVTTKKSPTGKYSTDKESLNEIIKTHELTEKDFVPLLLNFRELEKLHTTYFKALLDKSDKNGIIHTNFLQHGTVTGRFSSRSPNLQNIPSRSDLWDVRRVFIPREGYKFLISDYSQMELRVLAHFSKDENMVKTFKNGGDIHTKTMELTGADRGTAKGLNFGLLYGMGSRTLAKTLDITIQEAKAYKAKFFQGYPLVGPFIQRMQNFASKNGYIQTICGRRRNFGKMVENKWFNTITRKAVNSKVQGSAGDIMKLAMIKLYKFLKPLDAHILIQIHDEVIVEVPVEKVDMIGEKVVEIMENVVELNVPLKASLKIGDYWIKG